MNPITASGLARVQACPGSVHLQQARFTSEYSAIGTEIHAFLERCANGMAVADSITATPKEYRDVCAIVALENLPQMKAGQWAAEVTFAFDFTAHTAREMGRGLNRDYSGLTACEMAGTADVAGVSDDCVVVIDSKSGFSRHEADAIQLRWLGMAAALAWGKDKAICITSLIRPGEEPVYLRHDMDGMDIAVTAHEITRIIGRANKAKPTDLSVGVHCRFCPSVPWCGAQTNGVIALAKESTALTPQDLAAGLTTEKAAKAWGMLKAAKYAIDNMEAACRLYAERNPFLLANGKTLGPHETTRESLDGGVCFRAIKDLHGQEVADKAAEIKTSKSRIEAALRPVALAKGVPLSGLNKEVLERIRKLGGSTTHTSVTVGEHTQKKD